MSNCNVPDLDLFSQRYNIDNIQFSAGIESSFLHLGLWVFSWLIRLGLSIDLSKYANFLLKISNLFNIIGSIKGVMHVIMRGYNLNDQKVIKRWFIIADNGDGAYIPTIPSVIIAKKILENQFSFTGATAFVGIVTLQEYLDELQEFKIKVFESSG